MSPSVPGLTAHTKEVFGIACDDCGSPVMGTLLDGVQQVMTFTTRKDAEALAKVLGLEVLPIKLTFFSAKPVGICKS